MAGPALVVANQRGLTLLQYEYTLDDPPTWTQPWTARAFMRPAPGTGVIYEYACHEGNYAIPNILAGARKADASFDRIQSSSR